MACLSQRSSPYVLEQYVWEINEWNVFWMAQVFRIILNFHSFHGLQVSHHAIRNLDSNYLHLIDKSRRIYFSVNVNKEDVEVIITLAWISRSSKLESVFRKS